MVEKAVRLEKPMPMEGQPKRLGGILKSRGSKKSLETVPEYATAAHIERKSSFLSEGNEDDQINLTVTPNEEQRKFNTLCEGVQSCLALFQTSLAELLALKDELLKHALPPSLLIKVTLVSAKMFRSASDLTVPISELVRLVKLYSAPWETKSAALKKLHEDYENKQRQLNVALQKLVLVGIQSDRMAKERRVLNWERLFSRMMTSKAHGYRWKFLIESFKQKVKTGEVFAAGSSTDEEEAARQRKKTAKLNAIRRRSMSQRAASNSPVKSILQDSVKGSASPDSTLVAFEDNEEHVNAPDVEEENLSDLELDLGDLNLDEEDKNPGPSRDPSSAKPIFGISSPPMKSLQVKAPKGETRPRIKFFGASDSEDEEDENIDIQIKSPIPGKFRFSPVKQPVSPPKKQSRIRFTEKKAEAPGHKKRPSIRFFGGSDDEEETKPEIEPAQPQAPPVVKVDQASWTEEPDYERYLHVRLFRPVCLKAELPYCTLTIGEQLFRSGIFPEPQPPEPVESASDLADTKKKDEKGKLPGNVKQKPTNRTGAMKKSSKVSSSPSPTGSTATPSTIEPAVPQFEEFTFKLPDNNGYSPGMRRPDSGQEQLKIAIHPAENTPMIALATVKLSELRMEDEFEGRWSHTSESVAAHAQQLPLFSIVSDRDMPFNSSCGHVPVVSYESKLEKPKKLAKGTDTVSFEELLNDEIVERKRAEEAGKADKIPEPVYTEGDLNALRNQHAEEIQLLQEEFELRLNELSQGLSVRYVAGDGHEHPRALISAATSPIFMRSPSPTGAEKGKVPRPPSEARASPKRPRPKIANLPEWGKDLPQDFLVRLQMFAENSEKYRQELGDKTKRAIQEKYEQQMAVQNRLDLVDGDTVLEDVCLPAVFMPTRTGHVYTPKAHSYFHPPGSSETRLTQPPLVFKLPSLPPESQTSVLNLFDMGKTFLNTGPRWDWGEEQTRPHTTGEPTVNHAFPASTMGMHHPRSPQLDRSKTR